MNGAPGIALKHLEIEELRLQLMARAVALCEGTSPSQYSGVLAMLRGQYYVITARHCVKDLTAETRLKVLCGSRKKKYLVAQPDSILGRDWSRDPNVDVGIIKLKPAFAKRLEVQWLSEEDFSHRAPSIGASVFVCGFPNLGVTPLKTLSAKIGKPAFNITQFVLNTITTKYDRKKLEAASIGERPSAATDCYLKVPLGKATNAPKEITHEDLQGLSGAGVYILPRGPGKRVWNPTDLRLIGIFVGILPGGVGRVIRAEKIRRFLDEVLAGEIVRPS